LIVRDDIRVSQPAKNGRRVKTWRPQIIVFKLVVAFSLVAGRRMRGGRTILSVKP
jgi:hypothetical protein